MKKIALFIFAVTSTAIFAAAPNCNLADEIPEVKLPISSSFQKIDNVAQYKFSDWSGVVGIAKNISRSEAMRIADENSEITFFFYTKGYQMVLETQQGDYRIFRHGDTVFFKGDPWWGSAEGLADGYVKI